MTSFLELRREYHSTILSEGLLTKDTSGVPSNADKDSKTSVKIAQGILERIGDSITAKKLPGQGSGAQFEVINTRFLRAAFSSLAHMRPGTWLIGKDEIPLGRYGIAQLDQYEHLAALEALAKDNPELAAALGVDYLISPDVVIARNPETDEVINQHENLVGPDTTNLSPLRLNNNDRAILHASASCKWTIRSDRVQNARSEGLNLVKNRKGRLPHVVVITGEPLPSRLAAIALGTGEVDCVYHFALNELMGTLEDLSLEDPKSLVETMVNGKRLRDISDLPLDLVI